MRWMMRTEEIFFQIDLCGTPEVLLANKVSIDSPNQHFRRKPTEFILYLIKDGRMLLTENEQEYDLKKGDMILLDPSRWHIGRKLASDVTYYYVHFKMNVVQEKIMTIESYKKEYLQENYHTGYKEEENTLLWFPKFFHIRQEELPNIILSLEDIMLVMRKQNRFYKVQAGGRLMLLWLELYRILEKEFLVGADQGTKMIAKLMAYLKKYYSEKIDSNKIECEMHMNFDYLNRQFKKYTGDTIFRFLNGYRIEESKRFLKSEQYSNAVIASMTGFQNEFYFSKVFKKYTGITPSEYKKQMI